MESFNRHYVEEFDTMIEAIEYLNSTLDTLEASKRNITIEKVLIKPDLDNPSKYTMVLNIQYNEGK